VSQHENPLNNFGLFIAYLLPGFTALMGLPLHAEPMAGWGTLGGESRATVAGFLYETVEAMTAGLTVSTVRWLVVDAIHHGTGVHPPAWDFALLKKNVAAYELLIHNHYRYYQFYGNMLVALVWRFPWRGQGVGAQRLVYVLLGGLFFLGSRDALAKYYSRAGQLLGVSEQTAFGRV
jgi:hypothetical protein